MVDLARVAPEAETPVNPYSLLEAVNSSSETAHTGWLIFLAIMTYIMIAVAGVTHQDLLLGTPVELPILQVKIQLKQFFQFAPVVLVLFHLGVLAHLVLVSRKTLEFDHAIRLLEITERRTHPLRLELHNFFFVQAIAGPHRSAVMSGFLHAMSWLTLMILPVVLLLYIQVVFLPYHDLATTWVQRIAVLLDVLVLLLIGVFLIRAETSFFQAFARTTTAHPVGSTLTCVVLAAVCVLSLFAATIPGEPLDRFTASVLGTSSAPGQRAAGGFSLPFLGASSDGSLFGIFLRNLVVTDADLVVDKDVTPDEPTVNLRGRDLRYAKLDRSDLHQADFTGADLSSASLVGTDLRNAWLQCGDLSAWLLSSDRKAGRCTTAVGASFSKASLNQADMSGIDLTEANVGEAVLEGARLPYANLTGANFASARLRKADLSGGLRAPGANFLLADLQGADMTGAELQAADLRNAALQAVVLNLAQLQAARLNSADLEAATLVKANLQGADLTGARLSATDLRGALIWQTSPPEPDPAALTDLSDIVIRAPNEAETAQLKAAVDRIEVPAVRAQVAEGIAPLLNAQTNSAWQGSMGFGTWQSLSAPPPVPVETSGVADFPTRLTGYLSTLMCKARWGDGALATGIARRARTQQFRGNPVTIYEDLKSNTCAAREGVPPDILRQLGTVADSLRTN